MSDIPNRSRRDPQLREKFRALPVHLAAQHAADDPDNQTARIPNLRDENRQLIMTNNALADERDHYFEQMDKAVSRAVAAEARLANITEERDTLLRERAGRRRLPDGLLTWLGALALAGARLQRWLVSPPGFALLLALWALLWALLVALAVGR